MLTTYEQNSKLKLISAIVTVIVIAGVVLFSDHLKREQAETAAAQHTTAAVSSPTASTPASPMSSTSSSATTPTTTTTSSSGYKDGTFTASTSYYVPHGTESIQVSLTLKDGVVTGASIQNSENDFTSAQYQEDFASTYKSYVVGKKISSLRLGVVAGASDTTLGFNDAASQIASKAQA